MDPNTYSNGAVGNPTSVQTCHACTYDNGPKAIVCNTCGSILSNADSHTTGWICAKCTFNNPESNGLCELCGTQRHPQLPSGDLEKDPVVKPKTPPATAKVKPPVPPRPAFIRQKSSLIKSNREKHSEQLSMKVDDIVKFCIEADVKYTDPEFPAMDSSIGGMNVYRELTERGAAKVTYWLRPSAIRVSSKDGGVGWTVFNNPSSKDIVQGILGNCWFASSLSVLAENRNLLERIFITKEYNTLGVYAMRLCKDGQWIDVIVDDILPCLQDRTLAYCKAKRKQLWVPLIEKALAKVYGSYGALVSGTTYEGLATLTGFSCESFEFDTMKRSSALFDGEGKDLLWAKLLSSVESKLLLGSSCGKKSIEAAEYEKVGLVNNHAYSILDVQLVHGERLLHLRNTWGKFAWTGNWSEHSESWSVVPPAVKSTLSTRGSKEGLFWMSFDDLLKYFSAVHICFVREGWYETRVSSRFQTCRDSVVQVTRLCILERTEVDLSLHQKSRRGDNAHDTVDLLILVFDDHWRLHAHSKRLLSNHCTCSTVLQPGFYNVFCLSFARWLQESSVEYTLVCHSLEPVFIEQITMPPSVFSDALIHLAMAKGEATVCDPDGRMYIYTLNRGWCGQIVVAVNTHSSMFFHIKCDMTESVNLISNRELLTVDIIHPLHRQVVNIFTHMEVTAPFSLRCKQSFIFSRHPQYRVGWENVNGHYPPITLESGVLHRATPFLP